MKPKISFAKTTRSKPMENSPINPETIKPGNGAIHPARLSPGEPVIPENYAEKNKEAIDQLVDSYKTLVEEQQAKIDAGESYPAPEDEWYEEENDPLNWYPLGEEPIVPRPTNDREERYRIQEAKRAAKVQVDQKFVMLGWLIAVGVAFVASAIVSFNGITSVAEFVGLSATWMAGLFFFFVELMYLIFLVAYLVLASRVDEDGVPEKTGGALWGMISFAAIAVGANAFHTLDFWAWDLTNPQMWAGVVLSIAAPIAIISASKMASRVVFARAIRL